MHERRLARARHDGAAVLERAVVGEDDVPDRLRELRREALDLLDRAADAVVAERDLAVQPARVGQVDVLRVRRVGLELADVVQQRARHRHVAVDAGERRADRADRLRDAERVLEQAVAVGLVVVLRRRRRRGSAAHSSEPSPNTRSSSTRRCGCWIVASSSRISASICSTVASRAVEQIVGVIAAGLRRLEAAQVDLRAEARVHRVAPAHPHRRARARQLGDLDELLPDHARDRPGAVAELQAQVLAAVAPLAALGLSHEQDLVDLRAVGELVQEHGR